MKLLNNLPINELNKDNDYLGVISKGDLIKVFLEGNKDQYHEIKMFSLYGEWGSGKSTLMKYLQKELKGSFNTFFFDTWEFETDNNLPLSLLEHLISTSKTPGEELAKDLVDVSIKLFKGFAKSIRVSFPGLSIDGKAITETLESEDNKSFSELKKEFKTEFIRFEDSIKAKNKKDFNIVFIDDLDRCEPENILNLLSALKLFFTYGKRTIFLCGIDKKAVQQAVKTKYGDVVKASEYLEKIFDISFSIPKKRSIHKLVRQYFSDLRIMTPQNMGSWSREVAIFFEQIDFINPRRIKKALNKYQMLRIIRNQSSNGLIVGKIPNIRYAENDDSSYFETILIIYFIILNEFFPRTFETLLDLNTKKDNHLRAIEANKKLVKDDLYNHVVHITNNSDEAILKKSFAEIRDSLKENKLKFLTALSPIKLRQMDHRSIREESLFYSMIPEENTIDYRFFKYLFFNFSILENDKELSSVSLLEAKEIVSKLL